MPTVISFVRHGEVYNPDSIFYGRLSGFRLSDKGNYQAVKAAETLNASRLAAIFSSPLLRARRQYAGQQIAAVTHGDVIAFAVLWAHQQPLTAGHKSRLMPFGIADGYPDYCISPTCLKYFIAPG